MSSKFYPVLLGAILLSILGPALSVAHGQGTAYTYQGRFNEGTNPANGSYVFRFTIWPRLLNHRLGTATVNHNKP